MKPAAYVSVFKMIAPRKTTLPITKDLAVRDGRAWATDTDVYASWPVDLPDGMYRLVGPDFVPYPDSSTKSVDDMPPLPPMEGAAVGAEIPFPRDEIKQVLNFTTPNPARPLWDMVCFHVKVDRSMELIATDQFAMCRRVVRAPAGIPEGEYVIEAKALRALLLDKSAEMLTLSVIKETPSGQYMSLDTGDLRIVTRLVDAQYYHVDSVMPKWLNVTYRLERKEFRDAVAALEPYLNPEDRAVQIHNDETTWTLCARNEGEQLEKSYVIRSIPHLGGSRTDLIIVMPMSPPQNGPSQDLYIQQKYLKRAADSIPGPNLYVGMQDEFNAIKPVVFSGAPLNEGDVS